MSTPPSLTWDTQADWDNSQSRENVVTRAVGDRVADEVWQGYDPNYPPLSTAGARYWTFDDDAGATTAYEELTGASHTIDQAGVYATPGAQGIASSGAIHFDIAGTPHVLTDWVPSDPSTFCFWTYYDDAPTRRLTGTNDRYYIGTWDGQIIAGIGSASGGSGITAVGGQWYHIGVTANNGTATLYVDGTPMASFAYTGTFTNPIAIGTRRDGTGTTYSSHGGRISDVMAFDAALSDAQMQAIYETGLNGALTTDTRPMDEGAATLTTTSDVPTGTSASVTVRQNTVSEPAYGTTVTTGEHTRPLNTTASQGVEFTPTQALDGVEVTINDTGTVPTGYTRAYVAADAAPDTILTSVDITNYAPGDSITLTYPLEAGTPYYVLIDAERNSWSRSSYNVSGQFPYTTPELTVDNGIYTSAGASSTANFYCFNALRAITDAGGEPTPSHEETVTLTGGTENHALTGFSTTTGGSYELAYSSSSTDVEQTAKLDTATVDTTATEPVNTVDVSGSLTATTDLSGSVQVGYPGSETFTWGSQADWDAAQSRENVVTRSIGDRVADEVWQGYDPNYDLISEAVAYWSLDDDTETYTDEIGTADGTGVNTTPGAQGILSSAAPDLDGSGDRIEVDSMPLSDPSASWTASMWVYTTRNNTYQLFFSLEDPTSGESLGMGNWNTGETKIFSAGRTPGTGSQLPLDQWIHVTLRWDAATGQATFFLNGTADYSTTPTDGGTPFANASQLTLGSRRIGSDEATLGRIDEVLLFGRALTDAEINDLYTVTTAGSLTTDTKAINGEAIEIETTATLPTGTTASATLHQDTTGDGISDHEETLTIAEGTTTQSLTQFEAADGATYWLDYSSASTDVEQTAQLDTVSLTTYTPAVTTVDVAGTLNASASASGSVVRTRDTSGTLTASGGTSGSVVRSRGVTGALTASADTTGALTRARTISGTLTASADTDAGLVRSTTVSGDLIATGEASASITRTRELGGTLTAAGETSGSVVRSTPVSGGLTASGDIDAALTRTASLSGTLTASGEASGSVIRARETSGTLTASTDTDAGLVRSTPISGALTATADTDAGLVRSTPVAGALNASAEATGDLIRSTTLAGTLTATGEASATPLRSRTTSGSLTASTDATGTLTRTRELAGSLTAAGESSGSVIRSRGVGGTLTAAGTLTGSAAQLRLVTLDFTASATGDATLDRTRESSLDASTTGTLTTTTERERALTYAGEAGGTLTASTDHARALTFDGTGSATLDATRSGDRTVTFDASTTSTYEATLSRARHTSLEPHATGTLTITETSERPVTFDAIATGRATASIDRALEPTFAGEASATTTATIERERALIYAGEAAATGSILLDRAEPDTLAVTFDASASASGSASLTRSREAALSASGSATGEGTLNRARNTTLSPTGSATLSTTTEREREVTASYDGTGTLDASTDHARALTFDGSGSATLDATRSGDRTVSLDANVTGTFEEPTAERERALSLTPSANGTLSVTGLDTTRSLSLSASGDGTLTAAVERPRAVSMAASTTGVLSHSAERERLLGFAASATGNADIRLIREEPSVMSVFFDASATGTLDATTEKTRAVTYDASGTSTADITADLARETSLDYEAGGTLTASAHRIRALSFAPSAALTSTVNIHLEEPDVIALIFNASGSASLDATTTKERSTTLSASGSTSAAITADLARETSLDFEGTSTFAEPSIERHRALTFDGIGTATSDVAIDTGRSVSFDASATGDLTITGYRTRPLTFNAAATTDADATLNRARALTYHGVGHGALDVALYTLGAEEIDSIINLDARRVLVTTAAGTRHLVTNLDGERVVVTNLEGHAGVRPD